MSLTLDGPIANHNDPINSQWTNLSPVLHFYLFEKTFYSYVTVRIKRQSFHVSSVIAEMSLTGLRRFCKKETGVAKVRVLIY